MLWRIKKKYNLYLCNFIFIKMSIEKEKRKKQSEFNYTERFDFLMRLIRISKMLKSAKIITAEK